MPQSAQLVRTLARGLDLLNSLAQSSDGLAVAELHRLVGLDMATIGRLLATLEQYGYVTQLPEERKYRIGPAGLRLGRPTLKRELLVAAARPEMRRLREESRETVSIFVREGFSRICIDQMEGPENVRSAVDQGQEHSVLSGSSGMVLAAFAPQALGEIILKHAPTEPLTPMTIVDRDEIARQVELARQQQFHSSANQHALDLASLAAPILDQQGYALAALLVTGPVTRWTEGRRLAFAPTLIAACRRISATLERLKTSQSG